MTLIVAAGAVDGIALSADGLLVEDYGGGSVVADETVEKLTQIGTNAAIGFAASLSPHPDGRLVIRQTLRALRKYRGPTLDEPRVVMREVTKLMRLVDRYIEAEVLIAGYGSGRALQFSLHHGESKPVDWMLTPMPAVVHSDAYLDTRLDGVDRFDSLNTAIDFSHCLIRMRSRYDREAGRPPTVGGELQTITITLDEGARWLKRTRPVM